MTDKVVDHPMKDADRHQMNMNASNVELLRVGIENLVIACDNLNKAGMALTARVSKLEGLVGVER